MLALSAHGVSATPSRSTNIALTSDESLLINLNQDSHSATVFRVNAAANNSSALKKVAEIAVGYEPQCVAVKPDDSEAYVTTADGKVVVISLAGGATPFSVLKTIAVGAEPRGCALTPTGKVLYVANLTSDTVSLN